MFNIRYSGGVSPYIKSLVYTHTPTQTHYTSPYTKLAWPGSLLGSHTNSMLYPNPTSTKNRTFVSDLDPREEVELVRVYIIGAVETT